MDVLDKKQRHKAMARNRSKDTKAEVILRKALWHLGVRYRKNYGKVTGTPDIAITTCKIAIFVDGDFWHAKDFEELKRRIQTNRSYWLKKFKRNRERDMEVNEALTEDGWLVLRYWESDIKRDLDKCVEDILEYVPVKYSADQSKADAFRDNKSKF